MPSFREKVKIRIELDEFKEMSNYVSSLKAYSKDIPFAFATLILKDAFHYVFSYQKVSMKSLYLTISPLFNDNENTCSNLQIHI